MTTVVRQRPPVYGAIVRAIGKPPATVVYAYGDVIYAPGLPAGDTLPAELLVHEGVHQRQQRDAGGPDAWWSRYLTDPRFRFEQELEAYRAQVAFHTGRQARRACVRRVSRDLASYYGLPISSTEARHLLAVA